MTGYSPRMRETLDSVGNSEKWEGPRRLLALPSEAYSRSINCLMALALGLLGVSMMQSFNAL